MNDLERIQLDSYIDKALLEKSLGRYDLFDRLVNIANSKIEKSVK